jgi:isochorismate pyruvate lyase
MTRAEECSNIHEIRAEIDRIDRAIVTALADRLAYVHAAAAFKSSDETVRAPDRVRSMLEDRERWAGELGLDPLVIRRLYEQIVEHFTALEFDVWNERPAPGQGYRRTGASSAPRTSCGPRT